MGNFQEDSDLQNTIKISARRFEESPYISRVDDSKMIRGVYAGRYHAIYNDEDVLHKYWTLRKKALIYDVPEKPIEISGPDATNFLNKVLTREISTFKEGRGLYALACTPQGGIFMDGVLFKFNENKYWYVQADGEFETWLLAHTDGFDVEISDPQSRVLQIQGPSSMDIMKDLTEGKIDENLKYYRSDFFYIDNQKVYISRTGFTGELGYEIFSLGKETDHVSLWDKIMEKGEKYGMEFSSTRTITIRRIEAGILGNLTDIDTSITPFQAGLSGIVDLDKKNFVGQKALLKSNKGQLLFGFTCNEEIPTSGSKIIENNEIVGSITAGVNSPTLNCGIGYVRFNFPGEWVGKKLDIELSNGSKSSGEVVELPFFDKEKTLLKGQRDKSLF